jgi:hypothetical protein
MSKLSRLLFVVGVVASAVLVGIIWSGRAGRGPGAGEQASTSDPGASSAEETKASPFFSKGARRSAAQTLSNGEPMAASTTAPNSTGGWEDRVDDILGSTNSEPEKAQQMIELFPTLPPNGQEEVARHLTNLLPNQDYSLLRSYLTNTSLPENVLDVLLGDVLNRPNSLKLPVLLDVARDAQHPKAAEARDFLLLFIEADYGSDWDKWQAGIEQWLKANPD